MTACRAVRHLIPELPLKNKHAQLAATGDTESCSCERKLRLLRIHHHQSTPRSVSRSDTRLMRRDASRAATLAACRPCAPSPCSTPARPDLGQSRALRTKARSTERQTHPRQPHDLAVGLVRARHLAHARPCRRMPQVHGRARREGRLEVRRDKEERRRKVRQAERERSRARGRAGEHGGGGSRGSGVGFGCRGVGGGSVGGRSGGVGRGRGRFGRGGGGAGLAPTALQGDDGRGFDRDEVAGLELGIRVTGLSKNTSALAGRNERR